MSAVYLQPAGDPASKENLDRTVFENVERAHLIQSVTRGEARVNTGLIADLPRELAAWGATVRNRSRWQAMQVGDTVVFFGNRQVFATAEVVMTVESRELGRHYWGDDQWSLVFYLSRVVLRDLPLMALREHGLGEHQILRTLTRIDGEPASELNRELGIARFQAFDLDTTESPVESYLELVLSGNFKRGAVRSSESTVSRLERYALVRKAVLRRSEGHCEGIECAGMPTGLTRAGVPYLDVDHALDLALGGEDVPWNAVALCPNCHAVKTRGPDYLALRERYVEQAIQRHEQAIGNTAKSTP